MGLFSFLKNAGAKIFDKKKDAPSPDEAKSKQAENLEKHRAFLLRQVVLALNIEVKDLEVEMNGETATVKGEVESQADREKIVLAVGNVEGVAQVDDQMTVVNPEPEAIFHTVESGDSLSKIAKKYYGNAMRYPEIFEANKPMLKSADLIYPGQVLRIPQDDK